MGGTGAWLCCWLPREVQEDEEAQEGVEVWWGEEQEGTRAGVQIGSDTVWGVQEEDDGVAVWFRMTDTGRPEEMWGKCEEDQTDGPRVASGQGVLPGSGAGVPRTGQGDGGQGMVSRGGGDERLEGQDVQ